VTGRLDSSDRRLLVRAVRLLREPVAVAPDFEARVLARIRAEGRGGSTALRWLLAPLTLRVKPVWGLAAAAAVAIVLLVPRQSELTAGPGEAVVTLVAPFPAAERVEVAGSFTSWEPVALERDPDTGVFQGRLVVPAGIHEYMFVVDGDRWVADPLSDSYADDGFGRLNSVLVARVGET
jgi:hypothetical protein